MQGAESEHRLRGFPPTPELVTCLLDHSRPIAQRMRAVFYLRTIGGEEAVSALCKALVDKRGTCLFRHEAAYVLGQMVAVAAVPTLIAVLQDSSDDTVVRHEAGEALGAIAEPSSLALLDVHASDPLPEIAGA
jgi:deoxyhypusine monooxygenase